MTSEQEDARIERWHIECFLDLRFDWQQIQHLLAWGTEPHDVAELVERGCPPEVALRILQPVEDVVVLVSPVAH